MTLESVLTLLIALDRDTLIIEGMSSLTAQEIIECYLELHRACGQIDWRSVHPDVAYGLSTRFFHLVNALDLRVPLGDKLSHCA